MIAALQTNASVGTQVGVVIGVAQSLIFFLMKVAELMAGQVCCKVDQATEQRKDELTKRRKRQLAGAMQAAATAAKGASPAAKAALRRLVRRGAPPPRRRGDVKDQGDELQLVQGPTSDQGASEAAGVSEARKKVVLGPGSASTSLVRKEVAMSEEI